MRKQNIGLSKQTNPLFEHMLGTKDLNTLELSPPFI